MTFTNGSLTVSPAPLTVSAANATRVYGDPNPVFTGTISGIKNADNITATYASVATAGSPVGTFAIVPTLADPTAKLGNYSVTSNNGILTVTPVPLIITAANAKRIVGDPNPAFTGTITGLKNGDNITATYSSAATPASPAGTYPIAPTLLDPTVKLGNYSVTSNNGVLTVFGPPTAISVTPSSGSATSGNFQAVYSDANGFGAISGGFMVINNVASFTAACATRYDRALNQFFIINDAGNGWLGPIAPGVQLATVQNSQCVLNGATSSAVASGNNLTVNFSVSFLPAFFGNKNMYRFTQRYGEQLELGMPTPWYLESRSPSPLRSR